MPTPKHVEPLNLTQYKRIVVVTGAGISVASGLPTYRGTGGLWNEVDVAKHATARALQADPKGVWSFFAKLRAEAFKAQPNAAHLALAEAERRLISDQTLTILTQNVDGLHGLAGSKAVVEIHGTLHKSRCLRCDYTQPEEVGTSSLDCPSCPTCSSLLRPDIVLFEEELPVDALWAAKTALRECDLFLAVGTSGTVWPAANFVRAAEYAGARTITVNLEAMKPYNPLFHEEILGRAEEVLPQLLLG